MNALDPANQRRSERKPINFTAVVTNVISGQPLGHLGNLSVGGMMLISSHAPRNEALYQVSLTLPAQPGLQQSQPIELGIQEQWQAPAASPGQIWAGYRIISISDADAGHLDRWLDKPDLLHWQPTRLRRIIGPPLIAAVTATP